MSAADFMQLPAAVRTTVVVMLWPVIWAVALMIRALTGDVIRQTKKRTPPAWREVSCSEDNKWRHTVRSK
jgi:hypothetical protein